MAKQTAKTGGVNQLDQAQEEMRMQVVDLELKARFWKAQYEIRHYTLESERLGPQYDAFLNASREAMIKALEEQRKAPQEVLQPVAEEETLNA